MHSRLLRTITLLLTSACAGAALAAEDFRVRYNVAGTLGGEIFSPQNSSGWVGALAYTYINGRKLTGDDGNDISVTTPAGTIPLQAPAPTPTYDTNRVKLQSSGHANVMALALAYITAEHYAGGQLIFGALLPLAETASEIRVSTASPTLNWPQADQLDDVTKAAVQSGFNSSYQAGLLAQADENSGDASGIGDIELAAAWMFKQSPWKVRIGAALVLPTGSYSATSAPNIGFGNYYTLRPEISPTYQPTAKIALSGKLIMGFNTRNRDTQLKSGDWYGLEAAAGYMTPIGPVGLHGVHVRQYQDDENNLIFGSSRLQLTGVGAFFTTKLPFANAIVTLQHMVTTSSRNARHSDFSQLRIIKPF